VTVPTTQDLQAERDRARRDYDDLLARGLSLDLTRGKPSAAQLSLASGLLDQAMGDAYSSADGTDCRNYGGLQGLPELRAIFSGFLQVPVDQLVAADNSSLALMHDCIANSMLGPLPGESAAEGWSRQHDQPIAFICPVPGYDRHFALCQRFGIEMIPVAMTPEGPDMDAVESLVASDPRIKGMWCVPKYSNPDGTVYSDETVARLATMETAAPDFRIFWDNAYAVHHLTDEPVEIADLLAASATAGHGDRVFVFGSTSKVTLAGAGVAFFGGSAANVKWYLGQAALRTIGPDKLNQLRHARFLRDPQGVLEHMRAHRDIIAPKFAATERILSEELGATGLATWTKPRGGYFVSLTVPDGTARDIVAKAKEAGIALTPAGATHPLGVDPDDRTIRIAPTFPDTDELTGALLGLTTCVRMVGFEKLAAPAG
jgi:DNA-binding transcriptional MocR family regulator